MIFLWTLTPESIHTLGKPFHCHLGILYYWDIINAQHQIALRLHTQHLQCFDNLQIRNFNFWMLRSLKIFLSNKNTFLEEVFIYHMTILCWHQHLCCKKHNILLHFIIAVIQFYNLTLECPSAYHHWQSWHFPHQLTLFSSTDSKQSSTTVVIHRTLSDLNAPVIGPHFSTPHWAVLAWWLHLISKASRATGSMQLVNTDNPLDTKTVKQTSHAVPEFPLSPSKCLTFQTLNRFTGLPSWTSFLPIFSLLCSSIQSRLRVKNQTDCHQHLLPHPIGVSIKMVTVP